MSTNYALAEGSERGFKQIPGLPKEAAGGTAMAYGDAIAYVRANDRWEKAVAASVQPIGFCGNTDVISEATTTNNQTGVVTKTFVKGVSDTDASVSVIVAGIIKRAAEGAIPAGELVMLGAAPLTEVKAWDGVNSNAVVGRYVLNITQHHAANAVPAAADNDLIKIEVLTQFGAVLP